MKRILAIGLFAVAAGCGGGGWSASSYDEPIYAQMPADYEVEVQYLALCVEENKALCDWQDYESSASSAGSVHEDETFGHRYSILMRQKPSFPMTPDWPKH